MPKTQPMFEIKGFRGKNNLADPARILPSGGASFLAECRDADIDDEFMIHRRGGFGPPIFPGGGIHSLCSNGDICLFVQGADLKRLNPDYTPTTVISGVRSSRMVYVDVAGTVYLTNGNLIGFMRDGAFNFFPDPQQIYKSPMVPGHLIEYFNGRLFVARDNEIWFSDPMALMRTDMRGISNSFLPGSHFYPPWRMGSMFPIWREPTSWGAGIPGKPILLTRLIIRPF